MSDFFNRKAERKEMSEGKPKQFNFNSFLQMVGIGVLCWVGNKTVATSEALIPLKELPTEMKALRTELRNTVSREEFQQKMAESEAKRQATDAKLAELSLEIVKLKAKPAFR